MRQKVPSRWPLRKLLVFVVFAAACVALAACGSDESTGGTTASGSGEEETVELAYFLSIANSFVEPMTEGVEDAAKDLNAKVTTFDAQFDPSTQFNQMQDALSSGKDWGAWVLMPVDGATVAPGVEAATDAGISVACVIATCGPDGTAIEPQSGEVAFIGPEANRLGSHLGKLAVEACGETVPCDVFLLTADPKFSVDRAQAKAMEAVIAANPGISMESSAKGGGFDPEIARVATQDYLQGHPDVDVIVSTADQMTRGVELAVEEAGMKGEVELISLGASRQGVAAVKAGRWFATVVRVPYDEGYKAAELAIRAARGEEVEPSVTIDELSELEVVTKENAGEFEAQWDA